MEKCEAVVDKTTEDSRKFEVNMFSCVELGEGIIDEERVSVDVEGMLEDSAEEGIMSVEVEFVGVLRVEIVVIDGTLLKTGIVLLAGVEIVTGLSEESIVDSGKKLVHAPSDISVFSRDSF